MEAVACPAGVLGPVDWPRETLPSWMSLADDDDPALPAFVRAVTLAVSLRMSDMRAPFHEIDPRGLFLGSIDSTKPAHAARWTHVVNPLGRRYAHPLRSTFKIRAFTAQLEDWTSARIAHLFKPLCAWLDEIFAAPPHQWEASGGRPQVIIRCQAGVSRSATLAIAYLMHSRRLRAAAAFAEVQRCRSQVEPNPGFRRQLAAWEEHLFDGAPWPWSWPPTAEPHARAAALPEASIASSAETPDCEHLRALALEIDHPLLPLADADAAAAGAASSGSGPSAGPRRHTWPAISSHAACAAGDVSASACTVTAAASGGAGSASASVPCDSLSSRTAASDSGAAAQAQAASAAQTPEETIAAVAAAAP